VGLVLSFGIIALVIIVLSQAWSERARLARELREAPRVDIKALPEGTRARVVGTVAAGETLTAPLTGRPCVAYVAIVEERVSSGKSSRWVERIREVRHLPFTIDDGTGRAIVDPGQSKLLLEMDATSRSGVFDDATPAEAAFLGRHGVSGTGWFLNRSMRYTEGVITPGERVAVLGRGVREPDPDGARAATGYRDELPTRLRIGGSADHPILVTDRGDLTAAR